MVNAAVLGVLGSYGSKIRFGTSPTLLTIDFNTDFDVFDFLLPIGLTFWD